VIKKFKSLLLIHQYDQDDQEIYLIYHFKSLFNIKIIIINY